MKWAWMPMVGRKESHQNNPEHDAANWRDLRFFACVVYNVPVMCEWYVASLHLLGITQQPEGVMGTQTYGCVAGTKENQF